MGHSDLEAEQRGRFPLQRRVRVTLGSEVKFRRHFSETVVEAAVIEALVLLAGLHDGQGHCGVVPCAAMGDIHVCGPPHAKMKGRVARSANVDK